MAEDPKDPDQDPKEPDQNPNQGISSGKLRPEILTVNGQHRIQLSRRSDTTIHQGASKNLVFYKKDITSYGSHLNAAVGPGMTVTYGRYSVISEGDRYNVDRGTISTLENYRRIGTINNNFGGGCSIFTHANRYDEVEEGQVVKSYIALFGLISLAMVGLRVLAPFLWTKYNSDADETPFVVLMEIAEVLEAVAMFIVISNVNKTMSDSNKIFLATTNMSMSAKGTYITTYSDPDKQPFLIPASWIKETPPTFEDKNKNFTAKSGLYARYKDHEKNKDTASVESIYAPGSPTEDRFGEDNGQKFYPHDSKPLYYVATHSAPIDNQRNFFWMQDRTIYLSTSEPKKASDKVAESVYKIKTREEIGHAGAEDMRGYYIPMVPTANDLAEASIILNTLKEKDESDEIVSQILAKATDVGGFGAYHTITSNGTSFIQNGYIDMVSMRKDKDDVGAQLILDQDSIAISVSGTSGLVIDKDEVQIIHTGKTFFVAKGNDECQISGNIKLKKTGLTFGANSQLVIKESGTIAAKKIDLNDYKQYEVYRKAVCEGTIKLHQKIKKDITTLCSGHGPDRHEYLKTLDPTNRGSGAFMTASGGTRQWGLIKTDSKKPGDVFKGIWSYFTKRPKGRPKKATPPGS